MTQPKLAVRLRTARQDLHITRGLRALNFSSSIPGGYANAQLALDRPIKLNPDELQAFADCVVYDGRNGSIVWQGRIDDPGPSVLEEGQVWALGALGTSVHAQDRRAPALIYIDQQETSERWTALGPADGMNRNGRAEPNEDGLMLSLPEGSTITGSAYIAGIRYSGFSNTGLSLGGFRYAGSEGRDDVDYKARVLLGATQIISRNFQTATHTQSKLAPGDFTAASDVFDFRTFRSGATTTAGNDTCWAAGTLWLLQDRLDELGAASHPTVATSVQHYEVVKDLIGRLLPKYDGASAVIDATANTLDQLAYLDGATAGQVLEDLMALLSGYYWAAWESVDTVNLGGARFEWKTWPTTVRYEISAKGGLALPGTTSEVFNEVIVRWRDVKGAIQQTVRTNAVQVLTDAGLTRTGFLDLGDVSSSLLNAQRAGDAFLADHATSFASGTLVVKEPVLDYVTGRMVEPHEIRPGCLARIQEWQPRASALDATARDGTSVARIYETNYSLDSQSASLSLDRRRVGAGVPKTAEQLGRAIIQGRHR